jgi:hypothetical protein
MSWPTMLASKEAEQSRSPDRITLILPRLVEQISFVQVCTRAWLIKWSLGTADRYPLSRRL